MLPLDSVEPSPTEPAESVKAIVVPKPTIWWVVAFLLVGVAVCVGVHVSDLSSKPLDPFDPR